MRLADFKCPKCGKVYQDLLLDEKKKTCSVCGEGLVRIWAAVGVFFKGSGWTETFYPKRRE